MPATKLSVNVNKVALLRNTRDYGVPDVVRAARTAIQAGAHGVTVHPRPDQRHITPRDVTDLATLLKDHPQIEYNIEGNPFEGAYLDHIAKVRPHQATLVPDAPGQRTSDHGWRVPDDIARLRPIVEQLKDQGVRVSLFMDPAPEAIAQVPQTGADRVELYTESYARAVREGNPEPVLARFEAAARKAGEVGLGVNAGHDLNLQNLGPFVERVPGVLEVSIGHELISDAIWMGLDRTVKAYLAALGYDVTQGAGLLHGG